MTTVSTLRERFTNIVCTDLLVRYCRSLTQMLLILHVPQNVREYFNFSKHSSILCLIQNHGLSTAVPTQVSSEDRG